MIAKAISENVEGAAIILLDSFTAHFSHPTVVQELQEQFQVYLYPLVKNATQFCQPCDQFVIPDIKNRIRS